MIQVFKPWIDEREEDTVFESLPDVTCIRAPKRGCPRDLGYWYCKKCTKGHLEEQSHLDFPIAMRGCGQSFDGKVCGETHLGYEWCKECQAVNRVKPHPHIGEFEVVGMVQSE